MTSLSIPSDSSGTRVILPFLDGIRAVAALYVLLHHIWQFAMSAPETPPSWFRAFSVLEYGRFGVTVFIVVSGLCLMLPVVADPQRRLPGGGKQVASRRARRILPAYFVTLGGSLLLILTVPELRQMSGSPWDLSFPHSVGNVLTHLTLIHNWFPEYQYGINTPLWSVALEFQIYLAFGLLLLPLSRRIGTAWTTVATFGAVVLAITLGAEYIRPWMFGLFCIGMLCAEIVTRRPRRSDLVACALSIVALATIAVITSRLVDVPSAGVLLKEALVGVTTMAVIIALASDARPVNLAGFARRCLETATMRRLGSISYSVYLVHYPILALIFVKIVEPSGLSVPASFVVLSVIAIPLTLLTAAASYRYVELPFIRRRRAQAPATASDPIGGVATVLPD